MQHILEIQRAAFAVFEPFLGGLVTADVEVPRTFGNVFEILGGVDVYFPRHGERSDAIRCC